MTANGRLSSSQLRVVQGSIKLAKNAAIDYLNMKAAAKKAGVKVAIAEPLGGYRSFAVQAALKANPRKYGSMLSSSQIAPAGSSTHGLGDNVDIVNNAIAWVKLHGKNYGFTQRDPRNDPNCFHHAPGVHSKTPVKKPAVKKPTATQRQVIAIADIPVREKATSTAKATGMAKKGTIHNVFGYVHGEKVTTKVADTDVWFKLSSGYSWAGNFTNPGVGTLKNLTPVVKVTTTKAPTTSKVTSTPAPVVSAPVTTTPAPEPVPAPPVIQDPFTTPVNVRVVETVPPAPKDNWLVSVLKAIGALFSGAKS